jgi:hypothetical protein
MVWHALVNESQLAQNLFFCRVQKGHIFVGGES